MSDEEKVREEEVFKQDLSHEDLDASEGGNIYGPQDDDKENCVKQDRRSIYAPRGFPNCAATVEADSWCWNNDACKTFAVVYINHSCGRAWA